MPWPSGPRWAMRADIAASASRETRYRWSQLITPAKPHMLAYSRARHPLVVFAAAPRPPHPPVRRLKIGGKAAMVQERRREQSRSHVHAQLAETRSVARQIGC